MNALLKLNVLIQQGRLLVQQTMKWTKGEFCEDSKDLSKLSVCYLNI